MSNTYPYQSNFRLIPEGEKAKILLVSPIHLREFTQEIANQFADSANIILAKDNSENILENIEGVHGILGCPRHLFTPEVLERNGGALKWVHAGGAGVEQFIIKELVESKIIFTNGRIIQGPECADHALALLLALTRNIYRIARDDKDPLPRPIELMGKIAVVTGVGGIGLLIAERLAAFGTKVIGVDSDYVPMMSLFHDLLRTDQLHTILPSADFVITAVPHTSMTDPYFTAVEFSMMKKGAYFVNVSRGRTVDTAALTDALNSEQLAGAGLDVTDPEPLPEDHPLRLMSNVLITPHIAGLSDNNRDRTFNLMKQNITRFISDQPLLNVVNKQLGY
jgi:D-2-hydroxyacid dehydrogenase (NADP+)